MTKLEEAKKKDIDGLIRVIQASTGALKYLNKDRDADKLDEELETIERAIAALKIELAEDK